MRNVMTDGTFKDEAVARVYAGYEPEVKRVLLQLRALIYEAAVQVAPGETVLESLKWNQPSYTIKGATPIRIAGFGDTHIGLFFNCQTTLIESFRDQFGDQLTFSKNRAILLDPAQPLPKEELLYCIQRALTYHRKKVAKSK